MWQELEARGATIASVPFSGRAGRGGRIDMIVLSRLDRDELVDVEPWSDRDELCYALEAPVWDRFGSSAGQRKIAGTVAWTRADRRAVIATTPVALVGLARADREVGWVGAAVNPYGLVMHPDQPRHDQPTQPRVVPELEHRDEAAGVLARVRRTVKGLRSWVYERPGGAHAWRVGIALLGLVVVIVGIVLLALPGPGWLVIFAGLGIWATEFAWARSLLRFVRRTVGEWTAWLRRQPRWLTALVGATGLMVLVAVAAGAWVLIR